MTKLKGLVLGIVGLLSVGASVASADENCEPTKPQQVIVVPSAQAQPTAAGYWAHGPQGGYVWVAAAVPLPTPVYVAPSDHNGDARDGRDQDRRDGRDQRDERGRDDDRRADNDRRADTDRRDNGRDQHDQRDQHDSSRSDHDRGGR